MAEDHEITGSARADVDAIGANVSALVTRAVIMWAIRWTIGFALIWAITAWTGRFGWLWTAGIVVAGLSLAITVAFQIFFARKLRETHAQLDRMNQALDDYEDEKEGKESR